MPLRVNAQGYIERYDTGLTDGIVGRPPKNTFSAAERTYLSALPIDSALYKAWFNSEEFKSLSAAEVEATRALVSGDGSAPLSDTGRAVAALQRRLKPRNKAARLFVPRPGTFLTNASGTTFATTFGLAQFYDAFQVVLANHGSSAINIDACTAVGCSGTTTDSLLMGGGQTIVTVTFDAGSATGTIPLAATNRVSYKLSDVMEITSSNAVDRADGGVTALLNVRHYTSQAAATISVLGNGTDSYTNWRTASNGRIWVSRQMNGNQTATAGSSWSTTDISQTTIAGIIYYARGQVVTIAANGDSVMFGYGSTRRGAGFLEYLADYFHSAAGVAVETANFGCSGAASDGYRYRLTDALTAGIVPDIALLPAGTQNDLTTTIAAGNVAKWRRHIAVQSAACWDAGCLPVLCTLPATNGKAYAATDSLRRAHNVELMARRAQGQPVIDMSTAIGGTDGNADGQIEPPVAMAPDGTHPGDAGNAAIGALGVTELAGLFAPH